MSSNSGEPRTGGSTFLTLAGCPGLSAQALRTCYSGNLAKYELSDHRLPRGSVPASRPCSQGLALSRAQGCPQGARNSATPRQWCFCM